MQFNTPLRYPGGKGRLAQLVAEIIEGNDLVGGHYAEPYAGGAGVGITLLLLEYVTHIHINDINRSVHAFWDCVLNDTDALCSLISKKRVSMAEWHRQRQIQESKAADQLELAFSTFFLNRTNRSGIIQGGVIGGKKQTGDWKLDARFNKEGLIQRIEKIARARHRITLYRKDAATLIQRVLPKLPTRCLVYSDPPYYVKGKGLYEDHYLHEDHEKIANLMSSVRQKWIVSYDNVRPIRKLYAAYRQKVFDLQYSAQGVYKGSEVMIFCHDLLMPREIVPSRAPAA